MSMSEFMRILEEWYISARQISIAQAKFGNGKCHSFRPNHHPPLGHDHPNPKADHLLIRASGGDFRSLSLPPRKQQLPE